MKLWSQPLFGKRIAGNQDRPKGRKKIAQKALNRVSPWRLWLSRAGGIAGLLVESRAPRPAGQGDARPSSVIWYLLRLSVFVPQPFNKHLFFWFVVVHEQMADAA